MKTSHRNKIGKIGVKHILNKYTTKKTDIQETGSPVYVKVTFNRKSTQFRSVVKEKFVNIEEANKKFNKLFDYETKLIRDIVTQRAVHLDDMFNIAGIGEEINFYDKNIYDFIEANLFKRIEDRVNTSVSPFKDLIIISKKEIKPLTFFEAHCKLFGFETDLQRLEKDFKCADKVFELKQKNKDIKNIHMLDWLYGEGENTLRINAKTSGLNDNDVNNIVQFINNLLHDF